MEKLSGLDSSFYYLDSPGVHFHIGVVLFLEGDGVAVDQRLEITQRQLLERIGAMDHFRDRIAEVPFGLGEPYWVRDTDFEISRHVSLNKDSQLRSRSDIVARAGQFISEPLDKSGPLWHVEVVPELDDGYFALICKLHHTLIDGVLGIEVLASLFDLEANPTRFWGTIPVEVPESRVEFTTVAKAMGSALASKLLRAPKDALRAMELVSDWLSFAAEDDNSNLLKPAFSAPRTPINGTLSAQRVAVAIDIALPRVKAVAKAAGVSVNDVVLTFVSLALDGYLELRGWQDRSDLVAMMPIANPRRDSISGSNQISALFVSLANTIVDPVQRLATISRATKAAKKFHRAVDLAGLMNLSEYVPPLVTWALSRALHQTRAFDALPPVFNILISSVKGTDFPLYFAGAKLVEIVPFGPLADSSGLNLTALSYNDKMTIGMVGEVRLAENIDKFAELVMVGFELLEARFIPSLKSNDGPIEVSDPSE